MLWIEMTPNTTLTPMPASPLAIMSATVVGAVWGDVRHVRVFQMCRETPPETSRLAPVM